MADYNLNRRLPPIRACLFDMDGLLIDSEDIYTFVINQILHEYGKPNLPWSIKAQLQGRPQPQVRVLFSHSYSGEHSLYGINTTGKEFILIYFSSPPYTVWSSVSKMGPATHLAGRVTEENRCTSTASVPKDTAAARCYAAD